MSQHDEDGNQKHTEEMETFNAYTKDTLKVVLPASIESSQTSISQNLTSSNDKDQRNKIETTPLGPLSLSQELSSGATTSSYVGLSIHAMNPVVMLTRLEPHLTSQGKFDVTKDNKFKKTSSTSSFRKTMSKSELKKKTWYDEDESISDISVSDISLSDSEEFWKPERDKVDKKNNEKPKGKHDVKTNTNTSKEKNLKLDIEHKEDNYFSERHNNKRSGEKKYSSKEKDLCTKQVKKCSALNSEQATDYEDNKSAIIKDESIRSKRVLLTVKENKVSSSDKKDQPKADAFSASKARHHNSYGKSETDSTNTVKDNKDKMDDEKGNKMTDKNKRRHSSDSFRSESVKVKKPKLDRLEQAVQPHQVKDINKKENPRPSKERYELHISNINKSDIANETFRKFINLASDCAVYFTKSRKSPNQLTSLGSVVLYFENALSLQSALQRMSQLPVLSGNQWVEGMIKCFEIRPTTKKGELKDRWRKSIIGKLTFEFSTEKAEKLRQLYACKDRKREGTKRKSAQIHRIPSAMNHEMLTVLFPFSLNVQTSEMSSLQKGVKGPISIEFESQEWMEAVLTCFRQFTYSSSINEKRPFYLKIINFTPPKPDKVVHQSGINIPVKAQYSGYNRAQQQSLKVKELSHDPKSQRNQGLKRHLLEDPKNLDRKELGQRFDKRSFPDGRNGNSRTHETTKHTSESRQGSLQSKNTSWNQRSVNQPSQVLDPQKEALQQLAISRGLDPNNQDVIKILQMTTQLEALQALALKQRVEAHSLGIIEMNPNQGISAERLQEIPQVRSTEVLKRPNESRKAVINKPENPLINAWPQNRWEMEKEIRQRQEMERKQQEEYKLHQTELILKENIEVKKRQLEELEMRMKQQIDICKSLENSNRNYIQSPSLMPSKSGNFAEEQPFKNAPPTPGLLGPAPREFINTGQTALNYPSVAKSELRENLFPGHTILFQGDKKKADHTRSRSVKSSRSPDRHSRSSRMSSPDQKNSQSQRDTSSRDRRNMFEGQHDSRISHHDKRHDKQNLRTKRSQAHRNDYGKDDKDSVDPNRNDHPLDFNKRPPSISTEQAVKQDQYRTMESLKEMKSTVPPRAGSQHTADEMYLPVQFGKNAVKKTPKEIEDEKRLRFEEKQSEILLTEGHDARRFGFNQEMKSSHHEGRAFGSGTNVQGNEKAMFRPAQTPEHRGQVDVYMHNKPGPHTRTSFKNKPGILGNFPAEFDDTTRADNASRATLNSPSKNRTMLQDWKPGALEVSRPGRMGPNVREPPHNKEPASLDRMASNVTAHSMQSQFAGRMNAQSSQHRHGLRSQPAEGNQVTEGETYGHVLNSARTNNPQVYRDRDRLTEERGRGQIKSILKVNRGLPDHSGAPHRGAYPSKGRLWTRPETQEVSLLNETSAEQHWGESDPADQWGATTPSNYQQKSTSNVDTFHENAGQSYYPDETMSVEPQRHSQKFVNAEAFCAQIPDQDYNYGNYQSYPQEEEQSWETESYQPFYGANRSAFHGESRRGRGADNRTGRFVENFEAGVPPQANNSVTNRSQGGAAVAGENLDEYYGQIETEEFADPNSNRAFRGNHQGSYRGQQKGTFRGGSVETVARQHSGFDARNNSAGRPEQYPRGNGGLVRGSSVKGILPSPGTQRGRGFTFGRGGPTGRGTSFGRGAGLLPCPQSIPQEYSGYPEDNVESQLGPSRRGGFPEQYPNHGRAGGANFNAFQ